MQELNVVVLHAVIFVLRSVFISLSPYSTVESDAWWEGHGGYDDVISFKHDGQILQSVLICINFHGSIAAERLNK